MSIILSPQGVCKLVAWQRKCQVHSNVRTIFVQAAVPYPQYLCVRIAEVPLYCQFWAVCNSYVQKCHRRGFSLQCLICVLRKRDVICKVVVFHMYADTQRRTSSTKVKRTVVYLSTDFHTLEQRAWHNEQLGGQVHVESETFFRYLPDSPLKHRVECTGGGSGFFAVHKILPRHVFQFRSQGEVYRSLGTFRRRLEDGQKNASLLFCIPFSSPVCDCM